MSFDSMVSVEKSAGNDANGLDARGENFQMATPPAATATATAATIAGVRQRLVVAAMAASPALDVTETEVGVSRYADTG